MTKIAVSILAWPGTELTFNNRERFEFNSEVNANVLCGSFRIWKQLHE